MWRIAVVLVALARIAYAEDVDDGTTKGAVPVPDEYVDERGINFLDTTVTLDELPKVTAKWKKREHVRYEGYVPVALHISSHTNLALSFVAPVDMNVSDYPGTLETFLLFPSEDGPQDGNAFGPLGLGPIHAAIRVRPKRESRESTRRQVVVYVPPKSKVVLVATKLVSEKKWTPLLRVDTPLATRIGLINPGWH